MKDWTRHELERVTALRLQMLDLHPFWGHLLLQVKVLPASNLEAFGATDCIRNIWFNPNWTRHLSHEQLGFVLAHELGHILLISHHRRMGRDHHLWNCATDYAINRMVARIEHPARPGQPLYHPPNGTFPELGQVKILMNPEFDHRIAEAIYERLAKEQVHPPVEITVHLSGAAGQGIDIAIPNVSDHGGGIDIHLPFPMDDAMVEEIRERVESAATAWASSGERGDLPGEARRLLGPDKPPVIPWDVVLRQFMGEVLARSELTYRRPNLRYLDQGFVLPGVGEAQLGAVTIAVDTSASMSPEVLDQVAAEVQAISHLIEDLTLIVADADVHDVVHGDAVVRLLRGGKLKGGGGTDHRPVFDWVTHSGRTPELFIGLTDLFSRFPQREPPYPVLWVTPKTRGRAPWGKVIETGA
jgi:predicted metal-dependent peptidase